MSYQEVFDKLCTRYNTPHRKISLQSEVESLSLDDFMIHHQVHDKKEFLHHIVEYPNNITQQLVDGFHTESNQVRYLCNAVTGKKLSSTPLKNICTAQYDFDQLAMVLTKNILHEREIEKSSKFSKTYQCRFTTHHNELRKYDSSHRSDSGNYGDYRSQTYTTIPIDTIKIISDIAHDQLIASRDTTHVTEAPVDSEENHATVLTAHTHQVAIALEIDFHVGVMNIHTLIRPYATDNVTDVIAPNIHLQISKGTPSPEKNQKTQ